MFSFDAIGASKRALVGMVIRTAKDEINKKAGINRTKEEV